MLHRIDKLGRFKPVTKLANLDNYHKWISKFSSADLCAIEDYVQDAVVEKEKFCVAWLVPKVWDYPLSTIYEVTNDETSSALLLGRIVQDLLIKDEKEWLCTSTDLKGRRDIEVAFYWERSY